MSEPPPTSPQAPDLAEVRAWLESMIKAMQFVKMVAAILALITRMRDLNTELMKRLAHLQRKRPRSETLARVERQLSLKLEIVVSVAPKPLAASPPGTEKPKRSRVGRHPGRAELPAHLERIPVPNLVPAEKRSCPDCGCEMKTIGFSSREVLELQPARLVVHVCKDESLACPHDDRIIAAAPPPQLVPRGKLGDTLIVEALCDKYLEHQPIERQCLRYERAGVDIAPQTLGRSVAVAIDKLTPIAELIHAQTRAPGLLGTDATTIPVLDRDAPDGIRTGTMWAWTNARWVAFFYSPTGDSESVRRFLGDDLARTVQCDGTNILSFIERAGGKRPGCWSHGRRRFVEAALGDDLLALEGLRLIQPLFAIEQEATAEGDTAEARKARRAEHSVPALQSLRTWLDHHRDEIPPKTPLGKALGYLHRQWKRLILFLEDGNIELTNNRLERELRKLVLGRRNWLFTWEDLGGERTANILTIVATCVAHDINPRAYLHVVTRLLVEGWPTDDVRDLLPDRIARRYPALVVRRELPGGDVPLLLAPA